MAGKATITLDAWNALARQSDMARALGVAGKTFRDTTRRVFGTYVSHGDTLDERVRAFLFAYHITYAGNADARVQVARAFKDGDATPPIIK
jgi:hypothetical protein